MNSPNELKEITRFLLEYANRLMGSGVHTSRVIRNTRRIGKSLDVDVKMSLFQKTMVVSVCDIDSTEVYNEVAIIPAFPISFELNAELSALSWEAYDNHLPLDTLWEKYEKIIARPKMDPLCTLFLVGFANASFCALFGGDWTARLIVFSATLIGFYVKQNYAEKENQPLPCFHSLCIHRFHGCFFSFDTGNHRRNCHRYKRSLPGTRSTSAEWCYRHCRRARTHRMHPPYSGFIAGTMYFCRTFLYSYVN